MSLVRLDDVAEFNEEGQIEGLQFDNKERRLQEWREKKEEAEFKKLIESLHKTNYARRARRNLEKLAKIKEAQKRYRATTKNKETVRSRRRKKYEADPVVNTCIECGVTWSPPYEQKIKRAKFCGRKCSNRWHGKRRPKDRKSRPYKGILDIGLCQRIKDFLFDAEEATTKEIAEALKVKVETVRSIVCREKSRDNLRSDGKRPAKYRLAEP